MPEDKQAEDKQIYFFVEDPVVEDAAGYVEGERSGGDTGGGWGQSPGRAQSRRDAQARSLQQSRQPKRVGIKASVLKAQMQEMIGTVNELLAQDDSPSLKGEASRGLQLEEITLAVQVNAKGELGILGTGGELGGSGGITLKFARPK